MIYMSSSTKSNEVMPVPRGALLVLRFGFSNICRNLQEAVQ